MGAREDPCTPSRAPLARGVGSTARRCLRLPGPPGTVRPGRRPCSVLGEPGPAQALLGCVGAPTPRCPYCDAAIAFTCCDISSLGWLLGFDNPKYYADSWLSELTPMGIDNAREHSNSTLQLCSLTKSRNVKEIYATNDARHCKVMCLC